MEPYAYGWCHGPTGTSLLFRALQLADVHAAAGHSCSEWLTRLLTSVMASGVPAQLRPGFWDNDGLCCGTAGVVNLFLDHAQADTGGQATGYLAFARRVTGALPHGRAARRRLRGGEVGRHRLGQVRRP